MAKTEVEGRVLRLGTEVDFTDKLILHGLYGKVFEVKYHGAPCAAIDTKDLRKSFSGFSELDCCNSKLCHPNVVRCFGLYYPPVVSKQTRPLVVTEMVQETLTSLIDAHPNVPLYLKLSILLDVSRGLWYLHSQNPPIIHGDLSPRSIFMDAQFVAKVGNFGLSQSFEADKSVQDLNKEFDFKGPDRYCLNCFRPPLDVFSFGCVILYVVNQQWPNPISDHTTYVETKKHWFKTETKQVDLSELQRRESHFDKMTGYAAVLKPLVEKCILNDPYYRPRMSSVHTTMKGIHEPYSGIDSTSWRLEYEEVKKDSKHEAATEAN